MSRPTLNVSLAFRIHRLHRLLRRQFLSVANKAGFSLTPEQFFLLDKLHRHDGQAQSELADESLQDRPNLTRMVRDLERRGLLRRESDPDDGRLKRVFLTPDGTELYRRFHDDVVVPTRDQLFGSMHEANLAVTHRTFDELERILTE